MENGRSDNGIGHANGHYFPNKMGRIVLLGMEEVMHHNGVNAVLNLANLRHLLDNYPPNNFSKEFSFTEFSRLFGALDEMYGTRNGRGLALRAGRACFRVGIKDFGPILGVTDLIFRVMPMTMRLKIGFEILANVFNRFSDHQVRLWEDETSFLWITERCGICAGRTVPAPCCHLAVGVLQEAFFWISGGQYFDIEEITCIAAGDETCTIQVVKQPLN